MDKIIFYGFFLIFISSSIIVYLYSNEEDKNKYYRTGVYLFLFLHVLIAFIWLGNKSEYIRIACFSGFMLAFVRWFLISWANAIYLLLCMLFYGAVLYGAPELISKSLIGFLIYLTLVIVFPALAWFVLNFIRRIPYRGDARY